MKFGPRTIVEQMSQRLLVRWVPKWHEVFYDAATGGFHERLARAFIPVPGHNRRLVTQCRQLALYSHASLEKGLAGPRPDLEAHFEALCRDYLLPSGGWRFSFGGEGRAHDDTRDFYSTAFVIFALCHYARATGDARAKALARETLDFIDRKFRLPSAPGFAEALDENLQPLPRPRRQDPHMHLLEACLFAFDLWRDPAYAAVADEMVELFFSHFHDKKHNILCEWFGADLKPDAEKGRHVQPGHYFEWIWLLKKHAAQRGEPARHDATCDRLLAFANAFGWDTDYGGIYDEISPEGAVISPTKRIWPFTEALKANALMLKDAPDAVKDERKKRIADMAAIFREKYMQERGFWTERLKRDLTPLTDFMPGTTPYHVYFGIMETRAILRARGKGRSVAPAVHGLLYGLRRGAARAFRSVRLGIASKLR